MKLKDYIKEINTNKKFMRILWVICFVLMLVFFSRYRTYHEVVADYNLGVKMLRSGSYQTAENLFQAALWDKHTKRQECKIRINYALSIVKPITPESITEDNFDESIQRLEEAVDILTENDCAHENDSNGHSKKAQKLKEEIEEYIKQLKEQKEKSESEKNKESKEKKDQSNKEENSEENNEDKIRQQEEERKAKEKEEQIRNQMNDASKEGLKERYQELDMYKDYEGTHYYNYDEKCW